MTDDFIDDEDISESVLPTALEEAAVPLQLNKLLPWHQPRKQFVRERQWRLYTSQLIGRLQGRPSLRSGTLKYLTLPGIDQFDIELIGTLCRENDLELEAIGFLAESEKEAVKARAQFRTEGLIKRELLSDTSTIYPYRLEQITSHNGQAYREIKAHAPFHVLNIDACGSIATPTADHSERIIDALHRLIEIQLDVMRDPWLLFITTDARSNNLSPQVLDALKRAIRENANASQQFKDGTITCLGVDATTLDEAFVCAEANPERFLAMFSLGLSKWLLHNADAKGWNVKSKAFYSYSTRPHDDESVSMPCLAFEFSPRPVQLEDQFGAVNIEVANDPAADTDYSMKALERAQDITNLETKLEEDAELRRELAGRQFELLKNAGYQAAALDDFSKRFID